MTLKKPKALKKGDTIRIVASSSPFNKRAFLQGVKLLNDWGFKTKYHRGIFAKEPYLAGTDKRRASELIQAINDDQAKAILFARGGYGAMRLLPLLDKAKLKSKPKIILGYSDITSLLHYFQQRLGWVNFYGPVVAKDLNKKAHKDTLQSFHKSLISTQTLNGYSLKGPISLRRGSATGPLVGGCLSLIVSLMGTKYELNTDNKILFLEDTNERPYEIDRMLMHLKLAGKFNKCKGIVFGSLVGPNPTEHYIDTIKGIVSDYKFPVLFNFPAGHTKKKITLPLGIKVCLNTKHSRSLTFLEPALK